MLHPTERDVPETTFRVCGDKRFWKVKYNETKKEGLYNELVEWSAPSFLTVGKLKNINQKLIKKRKPVDSLVENLPKDGGKRLNPHTMHVSHHNMQCKKDKPLEESAKYQKK